MFKKRVGVQMCYFLQPSRTRSEGGDGGGKLTLRRFREKEEARRKEERGEERERTKEERLME